jgi:hypothetical protein
MQITRNRSYGMADRIPDGWVPAAKWDERKDKRSGGPVGPYRVVLLAAKRGDIGRFYPTKRRLYVNEKEAERFLASHYATDKQSLPVQTASHDATERTCELLEQILHLMKEMRDADHA